MNRLVQAARFVHPLAAATVVGLVFAQVYPIAEFVFGDANALGAPCRPKSNCAEGRSAESYVSRSGTALHRES